MMLKGIVLAGISLTVIGFGGLGLLGATGHSAPFSSLAQSGFTLNWNKEVFAQSISPGSTSYDKQGQVVSNGVTAVNVDVNVAEVHVMTSNSNVIAAHAYGTVAGVPTKDVIFSVTKNGSLVQIVLKRPSESVSVVGNQGLTLDVTIPKTMLQSLKVQSNVGKIGIDDVSARAITVHSNTGEVTVTKVPGTVDISNDTGAIHVASVQGDVHVTSSTGEIDVTGAEGAIDIRDNVGAITVQIPSITHDIRVIDDVGSVSVGSSMASSNVHFHLHTNTGHVDANVTNASYSNRQSTDVEGSVGAGHIQVDLESNLGAITFQSP